MKISYDQATNSLYIHLADSASVDSAAVIAGAVLDDDINGAARCQETRSAASGVQETGLKHRPVA